MEFYKEDAKQSRFVPTSFPNLSLAKIDISAPKLPLFPKYSTTTESKRHAPY